jgi:hypothetical protein
VKNHLVGHECGNASGVEGGACVNSARSGAIGRRAGVLWASAVGGDFGGAPRFGDVDGVDGGSHVVHPHAVDAAGGCHGRHGE